MAKTTRPVEQTRPEVDTQQQTELFMLEQRKVKALEKIANSLDALTIWFEEINKDEWSERLQWYLSEFHSKFVNNDNKN
jgi:hypothetical protein